MEKSHEYKTAEAYAHDYKNMAMSEDDLLAMLEDFAEALACEHQCGTNCGELSDCNCSCGNVHF